MCVDRKVTFDCYVIRKSCSVIIHFQKRHLLTATSFILEMTGILLRDITMKIIYVIILQGSARCYVTFITYDAIALMAKHTVRRSEVVSASYTNSFLISLLTTFGVSVSTTLLAPFAMADTNDHSALLTLFDIREIYGMSYIVIVGAVCGLLSSIMICLCASARLHQNLSEDGLLCPLFGLKINSIYPVFSVIFSGLVSSILALFFDLNFLLDIIGTGSLIASAGVASSVLVLRYGTAERLAIEQYDIQNDVSRESSYYSLLEETSKKCDKCHQGQETTELLNDRSAVAKESNQSHECGGHFYGSTEPRARIFNKPVSHKNLAVEYVDNSFVSSVAPKLTPNRNSYSEIEESASVSTVSNDVKKFPTKASSQQTLKLILYSVLIIVLTSGVVRTLPCLITVPVWYPYLTDAVACLIIGILICVFIALYRKPRHSLDPNVVQFKTPCIPLLPISVLWVNIYLLTTLSPKAWISLCIVSFAGKKQFAYLILFSCK
ncbi:High affinity cationic amino acid transporter 1 [Nymphon striatum]|nr:High affinity cationic amino acid transporter 1 [Nymphon striatum]